VTGQPVSAVIRQLPPFDSPFHHNAPPAVSLLTSASITPEHTAREMKKAKQASDDDDDKDDEDDDEDDDDEEDWDLKLRSRAVRCACQASCQGWEHPTVGGA